MKKFFKILYITVFIVSGIMFIIQLSDINIIINDFMFHKIVSIIFMICVIIFPAYINTKYIIISVLSIILSSVWCIPYFENQAINTEFTSPKGENTILISEYRIPLAKSQIAVYEKICKYIYIEKHKVLIETGLHPFSDDNYDDGKVIWNSENQAILEFIPSNEVTENIILEVNLR